MKQFDNFYAEARIGEGVNSAHLNLVIGRKGGTLEQAFLTSLAAPRLGHPPFFTVLKHNFPVKPFTLFVNKLDIQNDQHGAITWGPAQAGVAQGILYSVKAGLIEKEQVDQLLILAAVWVNGEAKDKQLVYENNLKATQLAVERAMTQKPTIEDLLQNLETAPKIFE